MQQKKKKKLYTYIYVCVCVCVSILFKKWNLKFILIEAHNKLSEE